MFEKFTCVINMPPEVTDDQIRLMFGDSTVITRVGKFNLVHLDNPSAEEIERRVTEFDPNDLFEDDCPLCQMLRTQGGPIVYEDPDTKDPS